MWGVRATGHVIEEERLLRRGGIQFCHVFDRLVRHVGNQVVVLLSLPRENCGVIAKEKGRPMIGLATHEPVEILETHPTRPLVERAGETVEISRGIVVLAEPGGRVTVFL